MGLSEPLRGPVIRIGRDEIEIDCPTLFGTGGGSQARRFLRRVFAFPQVRRIDLEPGKALVGFQTDGTEAERMTFIGQLATAIGGQEEGLDDSLLPAWNPGTTTNLHRFGQIVSTFEVVQAGPARLQLRHAAISRDPGLGRRLEDTLKNTAGVKDATATGSTGRLWISYAPQAVNALYLIRIAEAQLAAPSTALASFEAEPPKLGLANTTLGLAALGEFAVPVVLPVCVGMLVVSNLDTIRDAGKQLSQGKVGLPVLYTALLGCAITTGQIVAHALMEWSFKFWERRSNAALAGECKAMLEQNLPIPVQARLVRSDEVDALVDSGSLQPGERVRLEGPATIPVDGRIVGGTALVEQSSVRGDRCAVRKAVGDEVLAGSRLLNGQIEVEVTRAGTETQAAHIARHVIELARNLDQSPALRRQAEAMADKPIKPTLAIAGMGWAVGGLFTVGAVLHQDHASGPRFTIPMETLRDTRMALSSGVLVRQPDAWQKPAVLLESLNSCLPEGETDALLGLATGAGLYLDDGRAEALVEACRERGLVVRQPPLVSLSKERVTVRQGVQAVTLCDDPDAEEDHPCPLRVEIDGREVAWFKFRQSLLSRALLSVQKLRRQGVSVFLLSSRSQPETEELAGRLGTELFGGDFTPAEKLRFLQALKKRGVLSTYIGAGPIPPELAREAHLSISFAADPAQEDHSADLLMLGDSLESYSEVFDLALTQKQRIEYTCRRAMLPNLLYIVGGYAGMLNGITAGLVANVAVNRVYQQATRSLCESQRQAGFKRISV